MINKLTKKRKNMLSVYRDKWLKIGLSTDRIELSDAIKIWNDFNDNILKYPKTPIVILDSPLQAWLAVRMFSNSEIENQVNNQVSNKVENQVLNKIENKVENKILDKVWDQVENIVSNEIIDQVYNQAKSQVDNPLWEQIWSKVEVQVKNQVWDQVRDQVGNQVYNQVNNQVNNQVSDQVSNQVWDQVLDQVSDQVWNQVWDQVSDQVSNQIENQVYNQVWGQIKNQIDTFVWPYLDGNFYTSYFSFYDFCENVLDIKLIDTFKYYKNLSKLSLIYPLENICIMSQKPSEIHMFDGKLHNENGMAVKYADGFGCYSLHGVSVPEWVVVTPKEDIEIDQIFSETNVEVRRELIRKVGIDRIEKIKGSKVINEKKGYKLIDIPLGNYITGRYLKMKNPSLKNVYHFEGVPKECLNVDMALAWRNYQWEVGSKFKGYTEPVVLT